MKMLRGMVRQPGTRDLLPAKWGPVAEADVRELMLVLANREDVVSCEQFDEDDPNEEERR